MALEKLGNSLHQIMPLDDAIAYMAVLEMSSLNNLTRSSPQVIRRDDPAHFARSAVADLGICWKPQHCSLHQSTASVFLNVMF